MHSMEIDKCKYFILGFVLFGVKKHISLIKRILDSPLCDCGMVEDNHLFFFICPMYDAPRVDLISSVSNLCTPSLDVLLNGNKNLDEISNIAIIEAVHLFIKQSKRF